MAGCDFFSDKTRFAPVEGGELHLESGCGDDRPLLVRNPQRLTVTVAAGRAARIVVLHDRAGEAEVRLRLAEGAEAEVAELFLTEGASSELALDQAAGSRFHLTSCLLAGASARYRFDLNGPQAANETSALFLAAGQERCSVDLRTNHAVPDCSSRSLVKGAASGTARGEFRGLVYVARDAQRTDAQQQSRNLLLSRTARIDAQPQLEIYADDVRCSHGATVGQMDDDAILYMRQRGLGEAQARRLQLEGFAGEVIGRCGMEEVREWMAGRIAERLNEM